MRLVVLVRGVNVGGHNRLPMAELRRLLEALGGAEISTYLQSGNAVLTWKGGATALQQQIGQALQAELGLSVAVMVRTAAQIDAAVSENPFDQPDPKHFHVGFLAAAPDPDRLAAANSDALLPDRFAVGPGVVYLAYADVSQNSPLSRLRLGVDMTARNWRTVLALHELLHRDLGGHGAASRS